MLREKLGTQEEKSGSGTRAKTGNRRKIPKAS